MGIFKNIKNSIYNPDYYSNLLEKPFAYSLKYYLLFSLIVAVLITIVFSFRFLPEIKSYLEIISVKIIQYYPEELEITIKDGKALTNVDEPYFIEDFIFKTSGVDNLLVIDTKTGFSVDQFENYKTLILLTIDSLVYHGENGQITIQPLSQFPNYTINKTIISSLVDEISPFFKFIYPIVIFLILAASFFILIFRLIYLLLAALLVWLVAKIKKIKIGYLKSYQLGMHLITLSITITLSIYFILPYVSIPYLFTIVMLIAAIINLKVAPPTISSSNPSL